jgi:hypothetical protein
MLASRLIMISLHVAAPPLWQQIYVYKNRAITEAIVRRAEAAGYAAIVLTVSAHPFSQSTCSPYPQSLQVDNPIIARRSRVLRNFRGDSTPSHLTLVCTFIPILTRAALLSWNISSVQPNFASLPGDLGSAAMARDYDRYWKEASWPVFMFA